MLGLTCPQQPKPGIFAGKFGYSGKMVIKPYSIPESERDKFLKLFFVNIKISICGCWEWQGRIHNGYGCCSTPSYDGSTRWAHRISYALFNGPIAEGMHIDHNCRNRICVYPGHLVQCTPIENYLAIHRRRLRDQKVLKETNGQLTLW